MDTKNTTFDDAVDQTEHATNFNYNKMMTNLPKENYKEYDVYIDWETGTKHTLGIDDNQMPHLISSEPANIIDKGQKAIADAGEAKVMASEATIEANQKLWEGAKNFFVRAPKDYWKKLWLPKQPSKLIKNYGKVQKISLFVHRKIIGTE